ncbi:hypothetical protein FOA52_007888 [Chlamydomonas sp. UWO 241]|nr:hypothetical protein FOA52_007888 [Chlamydomonas sp. UWO 241]
MKSMRIAVAVALLHLACAAPHGGVRHQRTILPLCKVLHEAGEDVVGALRDAGQAFSQHTKKYAHWSRMHEFKKNGLGPYEKYKAAYVTELSVEQLEAMAHEHKNAMNSVMDKIEVMVSDVKKAGKLDQTVRTMSALMCAYGRLNPLAYEGRPRVSFLLQYWKRPKNIPIFIDWLTKLNQGGNLTAELLVNVDNPADHEAWATASWATEGAVVPVFSFNVHEIRAFNRLAGMARGDVFVVLGDDDIPPLDNSWILNAVRIFDRWPQIGILGLRNFVACSDLQYRQYDDSNRGEWFRDPVLNVPLQWVQLVDMAPMAVRRTAWHAIGGMDESISDIHECGIISDWDLCERMWVAGWQVAATAQTKMQFDGETGGTHEGPNEGLCWHRQQFIASAVVKAHRSPEVSKEMCNVAHELTLTHLQLADPAKCPYPTGCKLPVVHWDNNFDPIVAAAQ